MAKLQEPKQAGSPPAAAIGRQIGQDGMTGWLKDLPLFRNEAHFGDRIIPCLKDRPESLIDMLHAAVVANGDGEALVCEAFRASWIELSQLVDAFATGLVGRNITSGERIILFLDNRAEFVIALFAIARIGAIAVPVGVREQAPGLAYIAEQSGARAIIHEASLADRIPVLPVMIAVGEEDPGHFVAASSKEAAALPDRRPHADSPALIMYTSGTTGRPKGAIVTHLALVHAGASYAACMELGADDRSACVVPLSHISGISATVCPMTLVGGAMIVVRHFQAQEFIALAARERMTHSLMVPAMYNLFLARVDLTKFDLSAWRIGAFGGAPMPVPTIEGMARQLPRLGLMNCYGATETCGGVTVMPPQGLIANAGSVGWPIAGADVKIMDPHGREVGPGESGELWIAGATVTPGYWDDPEATAANLVGGYWRSGDLGSIDQSGFVHVLDRLKDMINRGGYKIFTAEVESLLMAHPAILEAAVVAKPCPILGERVHAFISLREGVPAPTAQDLTSYCSSRMTDYKQPESFTFSHQPLPRNPNGKVMKAQLRAILAGH